MHVQNHSLDAIQDIKRMMERSSRFLSLSGLSGISAGICALAGAATAYPYIHGVKNVVINEETAYVQALSGDWTLLFNTWLFWIAAATFVAALGSAFYFTLRKSRQHGLRIWDAAARRMLVNLFIPIVLGGIVILRLTIIREAVLIAPFMLLFYGLGLINASKYTLGEIRYLGYCMLVLGIINLWMPGYGIYFLALGFGVMHIIYGLMMWQKYERNPAIADHE